MTDVRLLITGADGFVGRHVLSDVTMVLPDAVVKPTARRPVDYARFGTHEGLDITDRAAADAVISRFQPTHVLHLAGYATTAPSASYADDVWRVNLHGTLNIANAIVAHAPSCWLLFAGSGLIYGDSGKDGTPLHEGTLLAPSNLYAATKAAADLALGAMARERLRTVRLRPFNHIGAGQTEAFVVPSFARQIARIEAGLQEPYVKVGDLSAERDFLDVEDVVSAYLAVVRNTGSLEPGQIFNVASGAPRRIGAVLDAMVAASARPIRIETDETRLRPSDTPRYIGDASLLRRTLGWCPARSFDATLATVLDDWRRRVRSAS
jgi:GDP-4-dehydro-6-deoxy-D-mannose reductase